MKTLLITGASGFLGWYLCRSAVRRNWAVYGTGFSRMPQLTDVTLFPVDLTNREAVQWLLEDLQPHAVIHAAAMGRPNDCQTHIASSYAINVDATETLATLCRQHQIKLVFVSTEQVFDGRNPPYSEADPVSPINVYGEHKAIAEQLVLAKDAKNLVCRMPLMYGLVPYATNFLQDCLERLQTGQSLHLFVDEIRMPLYGADAADGILRGVEQWSGIVHLVGPQSLSRYEFGQKIIHAMGRDESCLSASHQAEMTFSAPRPANLTMTSRVASSLEFAPQTVSQVLKTLL